MAKQLQLYEREYYFYDKVSKYVNVKIPKFIVGTKNFRIQILLIIRKEKNKRS
jgi:hypothetical protein